MVKEICRDGEVTIKKEPSIPSLDLTNADKDNIILEQLENAEQNPLDISGIK